MNPVGLTHLYLPVSSTGRASALEELQTPYDLQ